METISIPKNGYTLSSAAKAIHAAKTAQASTNQLWYIAQRAAGYVAYKLMTEDKETGKSVYACQLTPLTDLANALLECKTMRVKEYVDFIVQMSGGDAEGNGGLIRWDEKNKRFKKGKADWTDEAVAAAYGKTMETPWFKWAKPAVTNPYNVNGLFSAIRKALDAQMSGEYIPTAQIGAFLKGIQAEAVKNGLAEKLESGKAK